jgi:hypothetical protein
VKKIKYLITTVVLLVAFNGFAQKGMTPNSQNSNWQDKVFFGGGFGLSGGTWGTSISLSPIVGYRVTSRLSLGVGATYQYYKFKSPYGTAYDYSDNRYGGQVFASMMLIKQIFAYAEYSFLNYSYDGDNNDRRNVDRFPLGLGIAQPIGPRSSLNLVAAYDVLWESNNGPYGSPWVFTVYFSI